MKETNPTIPTRENGDCIQQWEKDLRRTKNTLATVSALKNRADKICTNAVIWEGKLKTYWENVNETEKQTRDIEIELGIFLERLCTVCDNMECVKEVLEILFCMIAKFYVYTDQLKLKLTELKREIDCLNEPELNAKNSKIVACIEELCTNLDKAIASQRELIKKVIQVLTCACELYEMLCGKEEEATVPPKKSSSKKKKEELEEQERFDFVCSLKIIITRLEGLFNGTGSISDTGGSSNRACGASIHPKPIMPLRNDPYYAETKEEYAAAQKETEGIKSQKDKIEIECNKFLSIKTSLEDAIKASTEAKACK